MTNTTINNKITRNDNDLLTIADIITSKALRMISARQYEGGSNADKILRNRNKYATEYDDLCQEVLLTIIEHDINVALATDDNGNVTRQLLFDNDDNKRKAYQTVHNVLKRMTSRPAKHQYIERYLDEVDENGNTLTEIVLYTKSQQEYDRQQIESDTSILLEQLKQQLTDKQQHTLELLLQGYLKNEIAKMQGLHHSTIGDHVIYIQNKAIKMFGETFTEAITNMMKKDTQSKRNTSRQELRYSEK